MKVETPQILWNSEGDKGINAALYSISMLESGLTDDNVNNDDRRKYGNVMVTSGNTSTINLWKVVLQDAVSNGTSPMFTPSAMSTHKIDYLCSLTRHEQAVNTVAFSPNGLHLATAGDQGCIIVWSVPPAFRGNGNGRHYWSTVTREHDLHVRVISRSGQGICDISWSADSKRFLAGTIDHTVLVVEDRMYDANHATAAAEVDSDWKVVYQNSMDHTHYVQGVSYDPLGVYLASMGSDRSVRVFPRKTPPKSKKKVLRPSNAPLSRMTASCVPPPDHQRMVQQLLTDSKLELGKSKLVKFFPRKQHDANGGRVSPTTGRTIPQANRHHLYADEAALESFFRRLSWTADGSFLVTPAALYHEETNHNNSNNNNANSNHQNKRKGASPSFATYLFARHRFDEPFKVLAGLEKPSLAVRPNPCLFQLPKTAQAPVECKENQSPRASPGIPAAASDDNRSTSARSLPYRAVFAVLTQDSILVYDTHHNHPLAIVRGLHYSNLVDCQWSADGHHLVVCSSDGYISIVSFGKGELGELYTPPTATPLLVAAPGTANADNAPKQQQQQQQRVNILTARPKASAAKDLLTIPPCEPGQHALEAPPSKRPKTRIAPTLISYSETTKQVDSNACSSKRPVASVLEDAVPSVGEAVTKLTLCNDDEKPAKKKKKIQPTLISAGK